MRHQTTKLNKSSGIFSKWHLPFFFFTQLKLLSYLSNNWIVVDKAFEWKDNSVDIHHFVTRIIEEIFINLIFSGLFIPFSISAFCYFFLYHKYTHTVVDIIRSSQWTYHLSLIVFFTIDNELDRYEVML